MEKPILVWFFLSSLTNFDLSGQTGSPTFQKERLSFNGHDASYLDSVLNVIHQRDRVSLSLKGDLQIYLSNIRYIFF